MKYPAIIFLFIFCTLISFGQASMDSISRSDNSDNHMLIYVNSKKKLILNGEKSSFQKLEKHLQSSGKTQAKIGTVLPTPLKVFAVFERVVLLMDEYKIETEWYSDPEFSTPFFKDVDNKD